MPVVTTAEKGFTPTGIPRRRAPRPAISGHLREHAPAPAYAPALSPRRGPYSRRDGDHALRGGSSARASDRSPERDLVSARRGRRLRRCRRPSNRAAAGGLVDPGARARAIGGDLLRPRRRRALVAGRAHVRNRQPPLPP